MDVLTGNRGISHSLTLAMTARARVRPAHVTEMIMSPYYLLRAYGG